MAISAWRASGVSGRARPSAASARASSSRSAGSSRRFSTMTWQRDSRAGFSSKDGFSVVAPTKRGDCWMRSEEHRSELQSLMRISYAVFCLKKKNMPTTNKTRTTTQHHRFSVCEEHRADHIRDRQRTYMHKLQDVDKIT